MGIGKKVGDVVDSAHDHAMGHGEGLDLRFRLGQKELPQHGDRFDHALYWQRLGHHIGDPIGPVDAM